MAEARIRVKRAFRGHRPSRFIATDAHSVFLDSLNSQSKSAVKHVNIVSVSRTDRKTSWVQWKGLGFAA